jgi:glutathione S-transferase
MAVRRVVLAAALHGPDALVEHGGNGRLGTLLWRHPTVRHAAARISGRLVFDVSERTERDLLAGLPSQLDRIDALVSAGVLNGETLNAADFAIAPSVALLTYRRDLRGELDGRPALALADRLLPEPELVT